MKTPRKFYKTLIVLILILGLSVFLPGCSGQEESSSLPEKHFRVVTKESGLHRVKANSLSSKVQTARILLSGKKIPAEIIRDKSGRVEDIYFYAYVPKDHLHTGYTLETNKGDSPGFQTLNQKGQEVQKSEEPLRAVVTQTVHKERDLLVWEQSPGAPLQNYWFWHRFTAPQENSFSFSLPGLGNAQPSAEKGKLTVAVQGMSTVGAAPNHKARVFLNGVGVGELAFHGKECTTEQFDIKTDILFPPPRTNQLTIKADKHHAQIIDTWFLDFFELEYPASLASLSIPAFIEPNNQTVLLENINTTEQLIGLTTPQSFSPKLAFGQFANLPITTTVRKTTPNSVYLSLSKGLYLTKRSKALTPEISELSTQSIPAQIIQADYIVLGPEHGREHAASLLNYRKSQGMTCLYVASENVYNSFDPQGEASPGSIRAFIDHVRKNRKKKTPLYVVLLGDANIDRKDSLGTGTPDTIPVPMIRTDPLGVTPADSWYVNEAGAPSASAVILSRIPTTSHKNINTIVQKIISYENQDHSTNQLFICTDNRGGYREVAEAISSSSTCVLNVNKQYMWKDTSASQMRDAVTEGLTKGPAITLYIGHGSITNWAGEMLLTSDSVENLPQANATIVLSMSCLNGFFAHPEKTSLAEALLFAQGKGAAAVFAPSGFSYPWEHRELGRGILNAICQTPGITIGEAVQKGKKAARQAGVGQGTLDMFHLFGDPALRVNLGRYKENGKQ